MYHELILALNGFPGDVFLYDRESFKTRANLQIPLLHPSEIAVLNDILEIATLHQQLAVFLESQEELSNLVVHDPNSNGGLYIWSVCNGVREIIDSYITVITELELQVIKNVYLSLTHFRTQLEPFRTLFRMMSDLIANIRKQKSSTVIIELVKSDYDTHIHLKDQLQRLVPWLIRTLHRQITNWVVFGTLVDPFEEFFIQKRKKLDISDGDEVAINDKMASEDFIVNYSMVPSHFPVSLVDKILFIGSSVTILKNSEKTKQNIVTKQKLFFETIQKLPVDTFRIEELTEAIEVIAQSVGKDMHHLVLTETDLPRHLGIIKDFYLTGRGELFHDFLLNLTAGHKAFALADIRNAFSLSASRVQVQEEILQNIELNLRLPPGGGGDDHKGVFNAVNTIRFIELDMKLEWPLQILFTEICMKEYNSLLQFLLQVRLIQLELNTIWVDTRRVFRFPIKHGPAELKNAMSFFIDHLQYYLQADVLESQYCILMAAIEKSENFDQIRLAHCTFQSNILAQSFHSNKKVKHFLDLLLNVCTGFVTFMKTHLTECEQKDLPVNEGLSKEVEKHSTDFTKYMDLLLSLLKGLVVNPQSGQYLSQFLLRLDFNSYYTKMTGL